MLKIRYVVAVVLCVSVAAQAEIYKGVDAEGNVYYSDKPVENSEQMNINYATTETQNIKKTSRDERKKRLIEEYAIERKEKKEQQAKDRNEKVQKDAQCGQAKDSLKRYKASSGLYKVDKDGNRTALSDAARKKSTDDLEKQIKKHCG